NFRISGMSASVACRISIACDHRPVPLILAAAAAPAVRRFVVHVTPEMIRHSRILDVMYFVGFAYGVAVLLIALRSGISVRLRDFAGRASRNRFVTAAIYYALLSLVIAAMESPIAFYRGFILPHQFDLTNQSFLSWLGDVLKAIGVNILILSPIAGATVMI